VILAVVRGAFRMTLVGLAAGGAVAWGASRLVEGFLFPTVAPRDATSFLVVVLTMVVTAGLASWLPAWRAVRVSPAAALREE
jgi:ABC-type lipoprotein release transport system permease subunit